MLEASADGGALKTERKGVSLYDVRVLGRAAHAGLEPERGVNATVELAHQALAVARSADPAPGHHRHARPSRRAGTTTNTVPAEGVVRGRRPGPDARRAGPGRRGDAVAAPGAARRRRSRSPAAPTGRRSRRRRRPRCSSAPALLARTARPARADAPPRSAAPPTATSPPASARRRSTASAPSAAARTPTTSTSSSTSCPAAPRCSPRWSPTCWHVRRTSSRRRVVAPTMTTPESLSSMDPLTTADRSSAPELGPGRAGRRRRRPRRRRHGARGHRLSPSSRRWSASSPTIWGRDANPPMTLELLRAFTKAGNYVGGAFDEGRLVGACVGFFHAPARGRAAQPHRRGRRGRWTGRHVGFALKLHQRAWALLRGVSEIAWTFDPLVSRNAYFNLVKLARPAGRVPAELLRHHARQHQRRRRLRPAAGALAAARRPRSWRPARGRSTPTLAADELAAGATVGAGRLGGRRAGAGSTWTGRPSLVAVPRDIGALRSANPALARQLAVAGARGPDGPARRRRPDRRVRPRRLVRREEGPVKLDRRRAAPDLDAAGRAVPDVVRHRRRAATSCCSASSPTRPRAGASAWRCPTRSTPRSTSTPPPTCCAASWSRPWPRPGPLDAHAVAGILAPFKGHRMAKAALEMAVLDAELRAAGPVVRPRARRGPRPGALRRLGRHHGQHPGAARRGRRLPRRGLRPDQAEDRARLGHRAGARGPRAVRRRRAAPGRRQHGVHARRRAATWPGSTRSTCC